MNISHWRLAVVLPLLAACGGDSKSGGGSTDPGDEQMGKATCAGSVARWDEACEPGVYLLEDCEDDRFRHIGMGCEAEWADFASCITSTDPDCEYGGYPDCDRGPLFQCQSRFVQATSCTLILPVEGECPDSAPYPLLCLDDAPSGDCTPRGEATEGVNPVCCP